MLKKLRTQMRFIMIVVVVAFLLSTLLMYEGRSRRTPRVNADGTMSDYEVAQVNGRALMRSELENRLRQYAGSLNQRDLTSRDMPAVYKTVLDQYVLESQMAREVEAQGIRVSDAEADAAMKAQADRYFVTREDFYQYLAQRGIKQDDYKKSLARQMASDALVRNAIGQIVISDDATAEFYDTMKSLLFFSPSGFMVYLANLESSADAEALREDLVGGKSWTEAISNDKFVNVSANNLTREPIFISGVSFNSVALLPMASLDIGEVSPVFSLTSGDYTVGVKTEVVSESYRPYDEVSGDIKTLLTQQEERVRLQAFYKSLTDKAQVEIFDTSLFPKPEAEAEEPEAASEPEVKEEPKPEAEEPKPEAEVKAEEVKTEEPKPEAEVKAEEVKAEEPKPEAEVKVEEVKA
ncbi:MAG: SurA N-terminal domain-containing protein, partial [Synergistaceae bacterium]|nr:SurA N-terminal domain-containing protein [Synergistaceae bacterium]